jgi:excisionase family DNA binding protein
MNAMKRIKRVDPLQPPDPRRDGFASGSEAAVFLGVSPAMVTKMVNLKQIPHRRFGRSLRIPWSWLLAQVAEAEKTPEPAA